jgi:hypothetical protein
MTAFPHPWEPWHHATLPWRTLTVRSTTPRRSALTRRLLPPLPVADECQRTAVALRAGTKAAAG